MRMKIYTNLVPARCVQRENNAEKAIEITENIKSEIEFHFPRMQSIALNKQKDLPIFNNAIWV